MAKMWQKCGRRFLKGILNKAAMKIISAKAINLQGSKKVYECGSKKAAKWQKCGRRLLKKEF